MPNTYFRFKQFTIQQDRCAMKVCTDACILGAWFSDRIAGYSRVLDIGSGTGLLMLMLAQRSPAAIHGIEIEPNAYEQLKENISQNTWKERLSAFPGDARTYLFPLKYDFIITNPPFFENDLPGENEGEQVAKHSKSLTLDALIGVIDNNLQPRGAFGILLPWHRQAYFSQLAAARGFYVQEKLFVKQSLHHDYFRAILHFSRSRENFAPAHELVIQKEGGAYTDAFIELLKDYYLYL